MKARKPLALILSAAMILSMLSLSAFAAEGETAPALADAESSWAAESINRWAKAGIVQGDSDGNFNPAKPLSRAELATIFVKMFGLTEKADNTYADLKGDEWYADAILKCTAAGIMQGDGASSRATAEISRAETMVMFGRAMGVTPAEKPDMSKFTDADEVPAWAAGYMAPLAEMGILTGTGAGAAAPLANIDKASTMALLDKAIAVYASAPGEYSVDNANGFVVVSSAAAEGEVVLTGTVAGVVVAPGSSAGKVVAKDLTADTVKVDGAAAVSIEGKSDIGAVAVNAAASVEIAKTAKADTVAVNAAAEVTNNGAVKNLEVNAAAKVSNTGTVTNLTANAPAEVSNTGKVTTLTANDAVKVDNKGTISKAKVKADDVILDGKKPTTVDVAPGTKNPTNSDGKEIKDNTNSGSAPSVAYYTVAFNTDGGSEVASQSVVSGGKASVPAEPTRDGYVFYGWALDGKPYDFTAAVNGDLTLTALWGKQAALGEWTVDRTEPKTWTVAEGWITHETTDQKAANDWYDWQGKGSFTGAVASDRWNVRTEIEITDEMLSARTEDKDGIRSSIWVQVDGIHGTPADQKGMLDWAILQFANDPTVEGGAVWQYWDASGDGVWNDIEGVKPTAGRHTVEIRFDGEQILQYIDGVQVNSYALDVSGDAGVSAPSYVIIQSRTYGKSYAVKWAVPQVGYHDLYPAGTIFIETADELKTAVAGQADNQTWVLWGDEYDITPDDATLRGSDGAVVDNGGQAGWYLPITADNLTVIGVGSPVLTSTTARENGAWATQSLVFVWGDGVTLDGLTITPNQAKNKTVEVVGDKSVTIRNCTFGKLKDGAAGSLYFNGAGADTAAGTVLVENSKFDGASVAFDGCKAKAITLSGNTWTEIDGYAIGNTFWGDAGRKTAAYTDVDVTGNSFTAKTGDTIVMARLNQTFKLDLTNTVNGSALTAEEFLPYLSFNNSSNWSECKENKVIVGDVTYCNPVSCFTTEDFGAFGDTWPGAYNLGWKYADGFDWDTITKIEVGMLDAAGQPLVTYTASGNQLDYQKSHEYVKPTKQSSAPFYQTYQDKPLAEGAGEDWTVAKGAAFESWTPASAYVMITAGSNVYYGMTALAE